MRYFPLMPLLLLAGCGAEPQPEQQEGEEAHAVPVAEPIDLDSIDWPDIEDHDLFGAGCSFIGLEDIGSTFFIAMDHGGYFKTGGNVVKLAPDITSGELPYMARETYRSRDYSAGLKLTGKAIPAGEETVNYDGEFTLRNNAGSVVFFRTGVIECGA